MAREIRRDRKIAIGEILTPKVGDPIKTASFICVDSPTQKGCGAVEVTLFMKTGQVLDQGRIYWIDTGEYTPQELYDMGYGNKLLAAIAEGHAAVHHPEAQTFDALGENIL